MKLKIAIVLLCLACVGLGFMLVTRNKDVRDLQRVGQETTESLANTSNQWTKTRVDLVEEQRVNAELYQQVKKSDANATFLTNQLLDLKTQLDKTEAEAKAQKLAAQSELAKRDSKIAELEGDKDDLGKRITDLNKRIGDLTNTIARTERELQVSDGDRAFLLKELKRLQIEKTDLERQFNDLKTLKAQVSKLKDELAVARRLEFIRSGVFSGLKGAEMLVRKTRPGATTHSTPTNFSLNVEFKQNSGAQVLPSTNTPPPAPARTP